MAARSLSSSDKSSSLNSLLKHQKPAGFHLPHTGKGNVIFTGPDGNADYKAKILSPDYIGIGRGSRENTGSLSYLWRAARNTPHPRPKSCQIGEIGWHSRSHMDRRLLQSRQQITLGEFRGQCQDRFSHRYQNPWYPQKSRPKSHQGYWHDRDNIPDDLRQVPIRQTSSARSKAPSTIGPLPNTRRKNRPTSPSSSSSSSYRVPNYLL